MANTPDNDLEKEGQPPSEARIMDLRHSRDVGAGAEEAEEEVASEPAAPEQAAKPEPPAQAEPPAEAESKPTINVATPAQGSTEMPAASAPPADVVDFPAGGNQAGDGKDGLAADSYDYDGEADDFHPELEQLRQIFGVGIHGYLRGQISMLANFALIYLGRAPNPATGLVTRDLDQARIAIDLLEFITARLAPALNDNERVEVATLLSELKYVYMQSAVDPGGGGGVGGPGASQA